MSDLSTLDPQNRRPVGPHSRPGKLAVLDKRSSESRFLEREQAELIAAVGGNPSPLQFKMIERAAMIRLRLHMMDKATISDPVLSERSSKYILAWEGTYSRILAQLEAGKVAAAKNKPKGADWAEFMAKMDAEKAASGA